MTAPSIVAYEYVPAGCRDWDPRAEEVAETVAGLVRARCPEVVIEHVGSTAIPGCAGRGTVDLMVTYPEGGLVRARDAVDALGFQRQAFGTPFPEERPMRVGALRVAGRLYRLHVHILAASSPEVQALRLFRDSLRADPTLVARYVAHKRRLIESGVRESPGYALAKGGFIHEVIASADRSAPPAATTGPPP